MEGFSKLKLSFRVVLGILVVEFISLASGITMGRNITSRWVILGFIATIVVSQIIAWIVTEDVKRSIKKVLTDLFLTSNNLDGLSKELTTTGHKLAEGSTQQAASIQETSSTLEESASMVHQTTQNTKEADNLAKQAKIGADKGNSEMKIMLDSMEELKKSSNEISKIIKVIDEIAFQTNILSLNAAVEAARAGDAGKGFAVVAEEVRNLAQRSAQAAKDTSGIIEGNISLSEKCLLITEQVSGSLLEIRDDTHKVSELLEEVSTASQEQEIGINQINKAISQMEVVIQENASTAQESASSAENLVVFSDTIKSIIQNLNFLLEGENTPQEKVVENFNSRKTNKSSMPISKMKTSTVIKKVEPEARKPLIAAASQNKEKRTDSKKAEFIVKSPKLESKKTTVNPEDIIPLDDF